MRSSNQKHKKLTTSISIDPSLKKKYEREVMGMLRHKANEHATFYNMFDEKIVRNKSIDFGAGADRFANYGNASIEMFNLTNGIPMIPKLDIQRGSFPDVFGAIPKTTKSRLKDVDLDWISNNLHKVGLKPIARKGGISMELTKLISGKNRFNNNTSLNEVADVTQKYTLQKVNDDGKGELSRELLAPDHSNYKNYTEENINSMIYLNSPHDGSDLMNMEQEEAYLEAGTNNAINSSAIKYYKFTNGNQYYPIASRRFYQMPSKKVPGEGAHPYAIKLPTSIRIMQRTSSDFYLVERRKSRILVKDQKSNTNHEIPLHPISPMTIMKEFYGRGAYYRKKIKDMNLQEKIIKISNADEDSKNKIEKDEQNEFLGSGRKEGDSNDYQNSKSSRYRDKKQLKLGKSRADNEPVIYIKDRLDEFSARKVTSLHPYKSYWLKCAITCLESDHVFVNPEIGYYIVQPYKDKIKMIRSMGNLDAVEDEDIFIDFEETSHIIRMILNGYDGLDDLIKVSEEDIISSKEAMVEFNMKLNLDLMNDTQKFEGYSVKSIMRY